MEEGVEASKFRIAALREHAIQTFSIQFRFLGERRYPFDEGSPLGCCGWARHLLSFLYEVIFVKLPEFHEASLRDTNAEFQHELGELCAIN